MLELGGKWHGNALIRGRIGRNFVIAHRRSLLRGALEQLRHASSDEKSAAEFPESELLGIKNLLGKGQFRKSQFTDIVGSTLSDSRWKMPGQVPVLLPKCFNNEGRLTRMSQVCQHLLDHQPCLQVGKVNQLLNSLVAPHMAQFVEGIHPNRPKMCW